MKNLRRCLALVLVLAVLLPVLTLSAFAAPSYDKTKYAYLSSKARGYAELSIGNLGSARLSTVKSGTPSVAKVMYYETVTKSTDTGYPNGDSGSAKTRAGTICLELFKAGSSTISFKVGSTVYKTKLIVKAYTNPVTRLSISGITSGKNLYSKFNAANTGSVKFTAKSTGNKLNVSAASGWKITDVSFYRVTKAGSGSASCRLTTYVYYGTPRSAASVSLGTLDPRYSYYLSVDLENTSNHGTQTLELKIN